MTIQKTNSSCQYTRKGTQKHHSRAQGCNRGGRVYLREPSFCPNAHTIKHATTHHPCMHWNASFHIIKKCAAIFLTRILTKCHWRIINTRKKKKSENSSNFITPLVNNFPYQPMLQIKSKFTQNPKPGEYIFFLFFFFQLKLIISFGK